MSPRPWCGKSARNDRLSKPLSRGNANALIVEERAFALLGNEHLLVRRIVDQAGDHGAFALERNRDGEVRDAVQEIGGAIERIDDPRMRLVGAFAAAAFLTEKAVARPCLHQLCVEGFFGATVGGRHEIGRALQRDLQFFQFAEVAFDRARGLARGGDHDIEQGGMLHGACGLPVKAGVVKAAARPQSTAISWLPGPPRRARPGSVLTRKHRDQDRCRRRPWRRCAI